MVYLIIYFIAMLYLAAIDEFRYKCIKGKFLVVLPVAFILFFISSNQFNVGTDYFSYIDMVENKDLNIYLNKGEVFFYIYATIIRFLKIDSHFIFYFYSFVNVFGAFYLLVRFEKMFGVNFLVLFTSFFIMTGFFHNQLNIIRQYQASIFVITSFLFILDRRFLLAATSFVLALLSHPSAILVIPFMLVGFSKVNITKVFLAFFGCFLLYWIIIPVFSIQLINLFVPQYSFYLNTDHAMSKNLFFYATKFYYLPIYILFIASLSKHFEKIDLKLKRLILLWAITNSLYLLGGHIGVADRLYHFFVFLNVLPVACLFTFYRRFECRLYLFLYLFFPYFIKVAIFPKAEYLYDFWLFNLI